MGRVHRAAASNANPEPNCTKGADYNQSCKTGPYSRGQSGHSSHWRSSADSAKMIPGCKGRKLRLYSSNPSAHICLANAFWSSCNSTSGGCHRRHSMNSSSFKDRFNLDYLVTGPNANAPSPPGNSTPNVSQVPIGLEPVLDSYGTQLISAMNQMPGNTTTLWDLARTASMRLDVILPVVQYLLSKGSIERVNEDPSGNDTYKLVNAPTTPTV